MEQETYLRKYWLVLFEVNERRFSFAEWRTLKKLLNLTYRRGLPDVYVARLDVLAESIETNRGNLQRILARLESRQILGHRGSHWWINDVTLWQALTDDVQLDPEEFRRASAADARLLEDNPLAPTGQLGLWPAEITDAEVQAEANQEHASDWPLPGEPPATSPDEPAAVQQDPGCKKDNGASRGGQSVVKITTGVVKKTTAVVKKTTDVSTMLRGPARVRPGNQVNTSKDVPGNQVAPGNADPLPPLDRAGWSLVEDLEKFCLGGADRPFTDREREHWTWRARKDPLCLEMCLRETMAHVRENRKPPIRSRAGWIKNLWSKAEQAGQIPPSRTPEEEALARRCREELEAHLGVKKP